jgi:hypothetical protein
VNETCDPVIPNPADAELMELRAIEQPKESERFLYASIDVAPDGSFTISSKIAMLVKDQEYKLMLSLFTPFVSIVKT